jgi:hypothetical protein
VKGPVVVCAGLSIALHAALIASWRPGSPGTPAQVAAQRPALPAALRARIVVLPAPPATDDGAAAEARPAATADVASPSPAGPSRADAVPTAGPALAAQAAALVPGEYVPRAQLSVVPQALDAIVLPYPPDGPARGRFVARLTLYIDEQGWVRHLEVDGDDDLPAELRSAARESFATARFSPGAVAGRAVKSRIRIEATFESLAPATNLASIEPGHASREPSAHTPLP